jgi:arabinogalactan oligomer/maltooligosaccharide transport system substrate-binding protein
MDWCGAVQWGDVPAWISAVATAGAFAGAIVAAKAAYKLYNIESARDQEAARERRLDQARRISVWYGLTIYREDLPGGKSRKFWKATVRNSSELPVYAVRVEFHEAVAQEGSPSTSVEPNHTDIPLLPPETIQIDAPDDSKHDYMVAVRFRDAGGIVWYRDTQGLLVEVRK